MKITFYDIFRYLRQILDGGHQTELTWFVAAFVLQRFQNYTSRFPESMSFNIDTDAEVVDFFVIHSFIKSYINAKCGKFCPESLMLCLQFLDAYILSQFGDNLLESPSLDVTND